jgi:hypothetical protein
MHAAAGLFLIRRAETCRIGHFIERVTMPLIEGQVATVKKSQALKARMAGVVDA